MDAVTNFNNKTAGRDKFFRLIQYSSKLIWATLQQKNSNKELINKVKELENILSTGRKLYRFGRGFETLYSCLSSMHEIDPVLHFAITFSKINSGTYLLVDHVIWLSRVGIINIDKDKWSRMYYKFWLNFVVLNLVRDFYEMKLIFEGKSMSNLIQELKDNTGNKSSNTILYNLQLLCRFLRLHKAVVADTIKNGCDIFIPMAQMGHISISPRTIGLLGMISSLAGMLPLIDSNYKLSP